MRQLWASLNRKQRAWVVLAAPVLLGLLFPQLGLLMLGLIWNVGVLLTMLIVPLIVAALVYTGWRRAQLQQETRDYAQGVYENTKAQGSPPPPHP